jgi:hypothetical protein
MKVRNAYAVVMLAVGCSGSDGEAGAPGARGTPGEQGPAGKSVAVSGERLRARWYVGADGARQFAGWYDSELDFECSFALAADGLTRCLPVSDVRADVYYQTVPDDCSKPYGFRPTSACSGMRLAAYAVGLDRALCPAPTIVYAIGAEVDPETVSVSDWDTECDYAGSAALGAGQLFSLGEPVSPSIFAEATVETD